MVAEVVASGESPADMAEGLLPFKPAPVMLSSESQQEGGFDSRWGFSVPTTVLILVGPSESASLEFLCSTTRAKHTSPEFLSCHLTIDRILASQAFLTGQSSSWSVSCQKTLVSDAGPIPSCSFFPDT